MAEDEEFDPFVSPVRIASRRQAPVLPYDMGVEPDGEDPVFTSIWFDQGGTTGWAVFCVWPEALHKEEVKILSSIAAWSAGEFIGDEDSQVDQMLALVEAWGDSARVGWEDFILQKFTMARDLLAPVRIAAAFKYGMHTAGRKAQLVVPQSASLAMNTVTDERLKRWGFWLAGEEHARDAIKHNITWLRRIKDQYLQEDLHDDAPGAEGVE